MFDLSLFPMGLEPEPKTALSHFIT